MKYYTLCVKRDGRWEPDFGDYDKDCVRDESSLLVDRGEGVKVVSSEDDQESINQAIDKLNNR